MMALVIIFLDAMGIGIIMPVLPALLREFVGKANVAENYGVLLALYAMMQVIFAPLLGRWSDRIGRRPVLLLSLLDAMETYFELLANEKDPFVKAVLGHHLFGYIHPYMDGNGRMARFIMNAFLIRGDLS